MELCIWTILFIVDYNRHLYQFGDVPLTLVKKKATATHKICGYETNFMAIYRKLFTKKKHKTKNMTISL